MGIFQKWKKDKNNTLASEPDVPAVPVVQEKAEADLSSFISPEAAARLQREKEVREAIEREGLEKYEKRLNTGAGFYNPLDALKEQEGKK